jgi:acetyl esterase/lipase
VDLWPGAAPGSEKWTYVEKSIPSSPFGPAVANVVKPALVAFLPEKSKATGTGIIIAPGGAFIRLAIDQEGRDVARWLQSKGIAAFVLKYRLMEDRPGMPSMQDMDSASKYAVADGIQALKVLRQHAAEWGVSPDKIGFMGFSAGATVAAATLLDPDAAARPKFGALLYGGPFGGPPSLPAQLPPLFLAWAQDDPISANTVVKLYDALMTAGQKPEAHAFAAGGHGFGLKKQGSSSDHWIDELYFWLESRGLAKAAH